MRASLDGAGHRIRFFFLPDSSVRDPAGAVLVDPDTGEPQEEAQLPFPADARQRKLNSEMILRNRSVDTPELLPPVLGEQEVLLRNAERVAWRSLALFIIAVRAESLATKQPLSIASLKAKSPLAFQAFSEAEAEFMRSDSPDEAQVIAMAWRYESLYTLQWALGFHEELNFADDLCDVSEVARTMVERNDRQMVNLAQLRPATQLLDALDQNQRLLWAARQASLDEQEPPAGLDGGVLAERQHALNWLTRFENAIWDEVDTPT